MRRSRLKRGCIKRRRLFRSVPVRRVVRALLAASLLIAALFAAHARASAQTAGTSSLMSTPAGWPSTGAVTGFTGLALDPLAIYLNPAGLAAQDERSLLVRHIYRAALHVHLIFCQGEVLEARRAPRQHEAGDE